MDNINYRKILEETGIKDSIKTMNFDDLDGLADIDDSIPDVDPSNHLGTSRVLNSLNRTNDYLNRQNKYLTSASSIFNSCKLGSRLDFATKSAFPKDMSFVGKASTVSDYTKSIISELDDYIAYKPEVLNKSAFKIDTSTTRFNKVVKDSIIDTGIGTLSDATKNIGSFLPTIGDIQNASKPQIDSSIAFKDFSITLDDIDVVGNHKKELGLVGNSVDVLGNYKLDFDHRDVFYKNSICWDKNSTKLSDSFKSMDLEPRIKWDHKSLIDFYERSKIENNELSINLDKIEFNDWLKVRYNDDNKEVIERNSAEIKLVREEVAELRKEYKEDINLLKEFIYELVNEKEVDQSSLSYKIKCFKEEHPLLYDLFINLVTSGVLKKIS